MKAKFYYKSNYAPTPNKPNHIGTTAIIMNCDGKILFEKRSDSNRWALIGCGLKIDETLEDCCKREILEETGLNVINLQQYRIYDDPSRIVEYPDGNILRIITVVYTAKVDNNLELTISNESNDLRFFTLPEILNLDVVETHRHIIDDFISAMNK